MRWINFLVGGLTGAIASVVFFYTLKGKETLASILTILTVVLVVHLCQPFIAQKYDSYYFEDNVKKTPLFNTISQTDPNEFRIFIDKCRNSIEQNEPPEKISSYSAELLNSIFSKHLLSASDEAIFNYINATVIFYKELYKDDPLLVIQMERGQLNTNALNSEKYRTLLSQVLSAKNEVILSKKDSEINTSIAANNLRQIMTDLARNYGAQNVYLTFTNPDDARLEKTTAAQIIISLYESLLNSGKENTSQIIRYLNIQNANKESSR